ncbi:hypothetical protein CBFG_05533 [Clostridiales bacterium 1_7_47FAA]|uniref:Uncharacterized protein n=1 Tax=Enterocloster hominis (ex Hitch et al. 2024) TaxID=1917870 RepID=A0ABV1DBG1_9FIRM|nr:hypothetical protein CBFG_05533 [Clostridiales bacterium 1_7_47FAA]
MMKHRMMTSLAIAAIAAATLGIPAFAAETKQEDCYTVTVRDAAGNGTDRTIPDLKGSENGVQFFDTEDGVTVSIVQADGKAVREKLTPQKTDENGNRYIEMADGSRVYVTKSKGVSVN